MRGQRRFADGGDERVPGRVDFQLTAQTAKRLHRLQNVLHYDFVRAKYVNPKLSKSDLPNRLKFYLASKSGLRAARRPHQLEFTSWAWTALFLRFAWLSLDLSSSLVSTFDGPFIAKEIDLMTSSRAA